MGECNGEAMCCFGQVWFAGSFGQNNVNGKIAKQGKQEKLQGHGEAQEGIILCYLTWSLRWIPEEKVGLGSPTSSPWAK